MRVKKGFFSLCILSILTLFFMTIAFTGTASAKSLYAIDSINQSPTPISAYNINPDGTLTYQATYKVPYYGWGAVGLGVDTDSATLFVTYEQSNTISLIDAKTMTSLGTVVAPGANNLAGIAVDQEKGLLYTVDRGTNKLYVYLWNAVAKTLTLQAQYNLPGLSNAYGIALDEVNDRLYVANYSTTVRYYKTSDWSLAGTITVAHTAINVAVDVGNGLVYSGGGFAGNYYLDKYDLAASSTSSLHLGSGIGVMGLGVDPTTGLVYCSTGYSGDDLRVYNSSLTLLQEGGDIGDPTGLAIPGKEVAYNPLNLIKGDGVTTCVNPGANITYTICYDNATNANPVNNVEITDPVPAQTSFVSATGGGTYGGGTVTWDIGTLAGGAAQQCVEVVVNVDGAAAPGSIITNYATIDSDETPKTTVTEQTDVCVIITQVCDVNNDGKVDIYDIQAIGAARGTTNPLYDIDKDGLVTTNDARQCVLECDNPRCAP